MLLKDGSLSKATLSKQSKLNTRYVRRTLAQRSSQVRVERKPLNLCFNRFCFTFKYKNSSHIKNVLKKKKKAFEKTNEQDG